MLFSIRLQQEAFVNGKYDMEGFKVVSKQ